MREKNQENIEKMKKFVFALLAVFWMAATVWAKMTPPTTIPTANNDETNNVVLLQDWSPPPQMSLSMISDPVNINVNNIANIERTIKGMKATWQRRRDDCVYPYKSPQTIINANYTNSYTKIAAKLTAMAVVEETGPAPMNSGPSFNASANSANTNRSDENQNDDIGGLSKFC